MFDPDFYLHIHGFCTVILSFPSFGRGGGGVGEIKPHFLND